jgi:hypothetical protein
MGRGAPGFATYLRHRKRPGACEPVPALSGQSESGVLSEADDKTFALPGGTAP